MWITLFSVNALADDEFMGFSVNEYTSECGQGGSFQTASDLNHTGEQLDEFVDILEGWEANNWWIGDVVARKETQVTWPNFADASRDGVTPGNDGASNVGIDDGDVGYFTGHARSTCTGGSGDPAGPFRTDLMVGSDSLGSTHCNVPSGV